MTLRSESKVPTDPSADAAMRPYPWKCIECKQRAVVPATIAHTAHIKHEGEMHEVIVPQLPVHRCSNCGAVAMGADADHRIREQLRQDLDLLSPQAIRSNRLALGLTQEELAEILGFAGESLSRWERGVVQSRTTNNLLKAFFELPAFREFMLAQRRAKSLPGDQRRAAS